MSNARTWSYTGPNPITLSELRAYCDLTLLTDQEDIEELIFVIQALDAFWMADAAKKMNKKPQNQTKTVGLAR